MPQPSHFIFVNPDREAVAADTGRSADLLPIPIRVSSSVPKDEVWFGQQMPDEIEITDGECRVTSRIQIIHKLKVTP